MLQVCLLCYKLESDRHFLWGKQHHDEILSKKSWKQHTVLFGIHNSRSSTNLNVRLRTDLYLYLYWWKPITVVAWMITSDGDVLSPFIFPYGLKLNTDTNIFEENVSFVDRENGKWKALCLATTLCNMPHKQETPVLAVRKVLRLYHP